MRALGKAVKWGRGTRTGSAMGRMAFGGLLAGSAVAGAASEMVDPNSQWGGVSESFTGRRDFARFGLKARAMNSLTGGYQSPGGSAGYYYGRPVDHSYMSSAGGRNRLSEVPGESVWGLYNMRRR